MVQGCERYQCLPEAGGWLDQSVDLLRMTRLVDLARAVAP